MPDLLREAFAAWLALVFAAAALSKFLAWGAWPGVVQNYRLLPRALVTPFAWALPPLELLVAGALLLAPVRSAAALAAALLLALFTVALGVNLARGRTTIDCGCFSSALRQPLSPALLVRNALLILAALSLLPAGDGAALSALQRSIAGGAALSLFFCYLSVALLFAPRPTAVGRAA